MRFASAGGTSADLLTGHLTLPVPYRKVPVASSPEPAEGFK